MKPDTLLSDIVKGAVTQMKGIHEALKQIGPVVPELTAGEIRSKYGISKREYDALSIKHGQAFKDVMKLIGGD